MTNLPRTPLEAINRLVREPVFIEKRTFHISRPEDSDRLLDHPGVRDTFAALDFLPYWADLWPAARMLAKVIMRQAWPPGLQALEIGCGLGLPGIAALASGLRVIFSDCDATALHFAQLNARDNGFDQFELRQLDWNDPPPELRVPVLLASDLIFELRNVVPLVKFIKKVMLPNGICLMTDQDRVPAHLLRETLAAEGLTFRTKIVHGGEPGGRRARGTLYTITL
jgi:predicted nicotinamide N-methyase